MRSAVRRLERLRRVAPPGAGAWWDRASAEVRGEARANGFPPHAFAAVVAILSPRRRWERNVSDALRATLVVCGREGVTSWPPMVTNKQKAQVHTALRVPGFVPTGPKVSVFYWLLVEPRMPMVCVDRHICEAVFGRPLVNGKGRERGPTLGERRFAVRAVHKAALARGEEVQRFQAAVWEVVRSVGVGEL